MKKINILIVSIILLFGFNSCDVLDCYPHDGTSIDNLSREDLELLHTGLYHFAQYKPTFDGYFQNDVGGCDFTRGGGSLFARPEDWIIDLMIPTSGWVQGPYVGYYALLHQLNSFLKSAEKFSDEAKVQEMMGTAYFFRGLTYYNLVSKYRNIIILTEPTNEALPNSPEEDGWKIVQEDLQKAIDLCPAFHSKYYVSRQAAKALMARTKLAIGEKKEAAALAEELINDPNFALADFDLIFRGKANKEEVFTFLNDSEEGGINFAKNFYKPATYVPTDETIALFKPNDKRREISITVQDNITVLNKYNNQTTTNPITVTRLSEMYLISAEGQGFPDGVKRLNELREFRGLAPVSPKSDEELLDAVLLERQCEFLGEGFRWFDLVRTGKLTKVRDLTEKYTVMPIPQPQIDLNPKLIQHECWK